MNNYQAIELKPHLANHRFLFVCAAALSLLFFAVSSFASTYSRHGKTNQPQSQNTLRSSLVNINDYNLVCPYRSVGSPPKILVNSYSLTVAFMSDSNNKCVITDLETLLIQPIESCTSCYNLTVATPGTHEHVYLVSLRANSSSRNAIEYSVSLDEVFYEDDIRPMVSQVSCKKNPILKPISQNY